MDDVGNALLLDLSNVAKSVALPVSVVEGMVCQLPASDGAVSALRLEGTCDRLTDPGRGAGN